jgi:hypothetical protein
MNTTLDHDTILAAVEEILAGGQPATAPTADSPLYDPSFDAPLQERAEGC